MSKRKSLVKKKNPIKVKKQQLCDRINQCKSLKELEGWEKTFSYHPVLKENYEWDYDYLLDLIEFKLKRMAQYFHTHNIVENEDHYGDICDKAVAILNAGYKTNIITQEDLGNIYVNDKNIHRFFRPEHVEFMKKKMNKYYYPDIRERKAKKLFWEYLSHNIGKLWD